MAIFDKIESNREWFVGVIVLFIVFIYIFSVVPGSGIQSQTVVVRVVTLILSCWAIATNILNVNMLRTVKKDEWGEKLSKLKPHIWVGLILGLTIPFISLFVVFGVVTITR